VFLCALCIAIGFAGTYVTTWTLKPLLGSGFWMSDVPADRALWDSLAQPGWPSPDAPGMRWITPTYGSDSQSDQIVMGIGPSSPPPGPITNYVAILERQGPWIRTLERRTTYAVVSTPPVAPATRWAATTAGVQDTALSLQGLPLGGVPIPREFAVTPIWPGFGVVWAIHAAALALAWIGARRARPLIRRWRGLCERCGYSLEGLIAAVCPECGTPVIR
jgi:hypothetical protein